MNDEAAFDDTGLQLPLDRPLTPGVRVRWETLEFELPAVGGPDVDPLGQSALLLAVFAAQLARYSGQSVVPLLVSTLNGASAGGDPRTMNFDTNPDASSSSLLLQARHRLRDGGDAAPAGGGLPAAVALLKDDRPFESALTAARDATPPGVALLLVASTDPRRPRAAFVYNTSLFDAPTVARLAGHYKHLLPQFAQGTADSFETLELLDASEAAAVRAAGTGQATDYPTTPIHQVFAARAAANPRGVAVRFRDTTLDYGSLDARANQLARALVARGAGRESRIVVCLEPGFDIAVALLGVLKAGAVYVPLDPNYPAARIQAILEDTQPRLVISRTPLAEKLGLDAQAALCLDRDADAIDAQADTDPGVDIDLTQTAYIFYTSGTTGKPKGVMASHRNLIFYILSAQRRYAFDANDVMPAIARFSFSISLFELLSPLAAGGTLLLLDREHVVDPARMTQTLQQVTFFHAGPSLLRGLVAYIRKRHTDFSVFDRVRHASSGGDMIPPDLLESLKEIFRQAEVFVIYGCSEIACMGCTYPVPRDRTVTRTYVGSAFENVTVRCFDAQRRPVPFGVVGEICFAGQGVVKGYLNRDELTTEKFFTADGQRFYGTGDMGRLNARGEMEILGRRDFQIQLRGMRIELGELEYALRKAPGVRDGVVAAHAESDTEKSLVAYVVFQPDGPRSIAAVRQHMIDSLPDYMVPAYYVELDALPLNHNRKVDRRALPPRTAADRRGGAASTSLRAAETDTEKLLVEIWRRLLGVDDVGIDDNFFELGGHSLLAFELIAEIETRIGVSLDGMDVLRESLEVLAALCDERRGLPRAKPPRAAAAAANVPAFEGLFFGPEQSLFGVYFPVSEPATTAVLICAPVGTEYVRAHFVLRKLATQLARQRIPVLRFDYFGTGDSLGENRQADCARWKRDIAAAAAELRARSGARRVIGVGVRLGGTLLAEAATELSLARVVLWDPVTSGARYLDDLRRRHDAYMKGVRYLRPLGAITSREPGEELLGFAYSPRALEQITKLDLLASTGRVPLAWLDTAGELGDPEAAKAVRAASPGAIVESGSYNCRWEELSDLEDILPDVGISRSLARMVEQS